MWNRHTIHIGVDEPEETRAEEELPPFDWNRPN
jgi:hypothetical protein